MQKIRIAIAGYGNIGKGVALAVTQNPDMELKYVISRRDPSTVTAPEGIKVIHTSDAEKIAQDVDVLILCGGSATDLPVQGPEFAKLFNTVDSFDNHARIPEYFEKMNTASTASSHVSLISCGWDPGMFSLSRVYSEAILPSGKNYTFWGRGVSQGHSDAIRRVDGVLYGVQYTVPIDSAIESVRNGENKDFTSRELHRRECFVVAKDGADKAEIEKKIKTMPDYFAPYDTTVNFITKEEFFENHTGMPHGGFVMRSGSTASGKKQLIEYSLKLESNPEFTSSVLVACARAVYRLTKQNCKGAYTMLDIPPALLSMRSPEELRKALL